MRSGYGSPGDRDHGLSRPGPGDSDFFVDDEVQTQASLDAVVTVVDAAHIAQHWEADEALEQIAFADVILLNKVDLVTEEELVALEQRIRGMNAIATIHRTRDAEIAMDAILGVSAFDLGNALKIDPEFLSETAHEHDETVASIALTAPGTVDGAKLNRWLGALLRDRGPDIFRMKGILNIAGEDCRFVFQGVHMLFEGRQDRPWRDDETRKNELVFIGRNLEGMGLDEGFQQCLIGGKF